MDKHNHSIRGHYFIVYLEHEFTKELKSRSRTAVKVTKVTVYSKEEKEKTVPHISILGTTAIAS